MIKKRNAGHLLAATSGLTLALALMQPAAAAEVNWQGRGAGVQYIDSWTEGANWAGGVLPTANDDVKINTIDTPSEYGTYLGWNPTSSLPGLATTTAIKSLTIGSIESRPGKWDGDLIVQNNSTLTVTGAVNVGATGGAGAIQGDGRLTVDNKSKLTMGGALFVGDGWGEMVVSNGSAVTVSGPWTVIGRYGLGKLDIASGSTMTSAGAAFVGEFAGSTGTVTVDGAGSSWTVGGALNVGMAGTGTLTIQNEGLVSAKTVTLASGTGSGTINIWTGGILAAEQINRGAGTSALLNLNGGTLRATANSKNFINGDFVYIGGNHGIIDTQAYNVMVSSVIAGAGVLYKDGSGTLTLSGKNTYALGTVLREGKVSVAADANLGAAAGDIMFNGGTLENTAAFTSARDVLVHTAGGTFETKADLTLTGVISDWISLPGGITKTGDATLTLAGANTYTGTTMVQQGTLAAGKAGSFSAASDYSVLSGGTLDLKGYNQTLASLNNAGAVRLGTETPGTTLTVAGDYAGNGGTIYLNTTLGGDDSATDRLLIKGSTSGTGVLAVTNRGGLGGQTNEGIKLVDVGGASNGQFTLQGDYVYEGQQAVIGGAYAYTLYQGGVANPNDGDWYLRGATTEAGDPVYQPGVPVYQALGGVAQELNGMGTLRQRVGNRYWSGAANPVIEQGDGPGTGDVPPEATASTETATAVWGRIEGSHGRFEPDATVKSRYDVDTYKMQAGVDGKLYENEAGSVIGGVTVHYGNAKADIESASGNGSVDIDGYGVGGTLTWYGDNGLYVDGQAQATWYQSDMDSDTANRTLADGNDGFGYALSIETGKRFAIDQHWTITPQAQLTWSSVDFDSFTDAFGVGVSQDADESLKGRLGIAAEYGNAWQGADGKKVQTTVYAIANLHHEFLDGSKTDVGGVQFASENDSTWGGIGTGGSYSWADGKYAVYGEVSADTSLENFADSYKLNGNLGLKVSW